MSIKWKIVAAHAEQGSIEVLYFDPDLNVTFGPWNIDLPVTNGAYPTEAEVAAICNAHIPAHLFERHAAVQARPSLAHIEALVGIEHDHVPPQGRGQAVQQAQVSELATVQVG